MCRFFVGFLLWCCFLNNVGATECHIQETIEDWTIVGTANVQTEQVDIKFNLLPSKSYEDTVGSIQFEKSWFELLSYQLKIKRRRYKDVKVNQWPNETEKWMRMTHPKNILRWNFELQYFVRSFFKDMAVPSRFQKNADDEKDFLLEGRKAAMWIPKMIASIDISDPECEIRIPQIAIVIPQTKEQVTAEDLLMECVFNETPNSQL
ncbi:MAG: hypothetical protein KDD48_03670 [Bdellovibrionales bacterium]|nr:hypothetical protein [Bdellovibrionales bacterium]